jgi:capsular polysaccharide biosynthesis protein
MIRKLLEAFFRHKLLLLLPPILIPGIATPIAFATQPPVFETSTSVWVDRSALTPSDGSSPWDSPSQIQSNRMSELLKTQVFINQVAQRTSMASLVGSRTGETRLDGLITRGVSISRAGDHVLVVTAQGPTAQIAYELATGIVDAYQEKIAADEADQSAVAVSFYQSQAQDADQQVAKASQDLRRYLAVLAANGSDTSTADTSGLDQRSTLDPKLSALQSALTEAQTASENARKAMQGAQRAASAAVQGQQLDFQILDAAQMPASSSRPIKKIIVYPIAALVAGLGLSAIALVLLVAGDRSMRSEGDATLSLRLLGTVPNLTVKRMPKQLKPVATRRAIGSVAGMALPAPGRAR